MVALRAQEDLRVVTGAVEASASAMQTKEGNFSAWDNAVKQLPKLESDLRVIPGKLKDPLTGLPSWIYSDILQKVLEALPQNQIWADAIEVKPVSLKPDHLLVKGREKPFVLQVEVAGHRLVPQGEKQTGVLEYIEKEFVQHIKDLSKEAGTPAKKVPFAVEYAQGTWFTKEGVKEEPALAPPGGDQSYYSFKAIWFVNPEFYEAKP